MKLNCTKLPDSLQNKTAVIRVDYNVPIFQGQIQDDSRIQASLKTLNQLLTQGNQLRIITHLGRPKGKEAEFSTQFLTQVLSTLLHRPVSFSPEFIPSQEPIVLYENLRFWSGEETNDPQFSQTLAHLGDVYVNDAFSVSHRAHASVEGITHHLPSFAGLQLFTEIEALEHSLSAPKRPLMLIIGGSKVSTKISILRHLLPKVDMCFIGGGMANTFLASLGYNVGTSLVEQDWVAEARSLRQAFPHILLPLDVVVTRDIQSHSPSRTCLPQEVKDDEKIVDMGPQSIHMIAQHLQHAQTLVWNGPLGVFEVPPFDQGSLSVMKAVAESALFSVIGGGETVAAAHKAGVTAQLGFISTAGGAFLEWLEGKQLPGIMALCQNASA